MTKWDEQFFELYKRYRYEDQLGWYERRQAEFQTARNHAVNMNALLLVLTATASTLAAANVFGPRALWAVLTVVFPALSTALSAYDALYAFERQAKLYGDAALALRRARVHAPNVMSPNTEAGYRRALSVFVNRTENVLRTEQGQWGQLASEIETVEPKMVED